MPQIGEKVHIWPAPGRKVQASERSVDAMAGGAFLAPEGRDVIWSEFHHEHHGMGDYLLHSPPDNQAALLPPEQMELSQHAQSEE